MLEGAQCNTWVWHPQTHACWLKHQDPAALARATAALAKAAQQRGGSPWTSGVNLQRKLCAECGERVSYTGCIRKDRCNTSRTCGSPAIDGYSHVVPKCFATSPTALRYRSLLAKGTRLEGHAEQAADYDGLGVRWGIGHKKRSWHECEQACRDHRPGAGGGPFNTLPCNVWTWCSRDVCFEPDAHSHSLGDCWLKFSEDPEAPEVNMRTPGMRPAFMQRHRREMAGGCSWVSGALLEPGVRMTNGTWGPRAFW